MNYIMKVQIIVILALLPFFSFSQEFKRKTFEYEKLASENFAECDESTYLILDKSFAAVQQNNSAFAVTNSKNLYETNKGCYQIFDVYGYSLFRNGKWFEGLEIIEKGIQKFGSVPDLIKRKSEMSLEMAQLGTGRKNIDGNSVYQANSIEYDEEQFTTENLKSALLDLQYLTGYNNRSEDVFYVAKIHQILKQYDKSTDIFYKLLDDEEYKFDAVFNIADNYITQNKLSDAEAELNKLLISNPKEWTVFEKLAEIYTKQNNAEKADKCEQKAVYYSNMPYFSNLEYSAENFESLILFGTDDSPADEKISKLNALFEKNNHEHTIDICLMILKLHANHGNGVERRAAEILGSIGKPAIEKVNKLFQLNVSTCTVTNLADIMATVKEESSWELMKQYLPNILNMPMTVIPPSLAEKMVQFDEERGIKEILTVVKPLLSSKKNHNDPLAELSGFGQYTFYVPLKEVSEKKLKKIAEELNYSDKEFKLLKEKINEYR